MESPVADSRPAPLPRLVRRSTLVHAGFSDDELRAQVRTGRIERPARGVYGKPIKGTEPHETERERYLRRSVAHAMTTPSSVASHLSAAAIHGMAFARAPLTTVHLTRPGVSGGRRTPNLWIHTARIADDEIVTVQGLQVTTVARTVLDIARTERIRNAVAVADDALHRGLVEPADVVASLARAAHARGMRSARRALALVDGRSESVGETFARLALRATGLPAPQLQLDVYSERAEFLGRSDFGYDDVAVLIEFDGKSKYGRLRRAGETVEDAVLREKAREDALREAGFIVVRLVWSDLADVVLLRARIVDAIRRGRRAVAAGLVTGRCVRRAPLWIAV